MITAAVVLFGTFVAVAQPASAATHTVALGMDLSGGQLTSTGVTNVENQFGHKLAFTREFFLWNTTWPQSFLSWLGARGTVPVISVKAKRTNGTDVPWPDIAAAQPGSALYTDMKNWADKIKALGYPVMFTFNHEPEASSRADLGGPSDYIAAWRKFHDVFAAEGVTNVRFIEILTDYAYKVPSTDRRYGWNWYPGDAYVDDIAVDAYNWGTCRRATESWQSLQTAISGFMKFGAQHPDKPMYLTEFASPEDLLKPGRKAQWISDAQTLLKGSAYSQIVGISYFNIVPGNYPGCNFPVTSSSTATTAFKNLAADPFYQGTVSFDATPPPPPPPPPTGGTVSFVGASSTTANATTETVKVPSGASAGDGLVMIGTSATKGTLTAPTGWTQVGASNSASMSSVVWQRVATASDAGSSVKVTFPALTKGSVEIIDYTGTNSSGPVRTAAAAIRDVSSTSLTAPAVSGAQAGDALLSYWSVRTSATTTITPPAADMRRSSELGSGGGQITSTSSDNSTDVAGGHVATVSPAAGHAITWSVLLAAA